MDFSQALEQLKAGNKVTRDGWNGKDQWVVRQNGYPEGIPLNRNTAQATGIAEGTVMVFEPYFMLYTPWSTFVPWTPTTGDLNADDWQVYYTEADSARETAVILADPEIMADLAEALADDAPHSEQELSVVLQVARFEKADISGKEAARFRLIRTLLQPVVVRQVKESGPSLLVETTFSATTLTALVGVILRLQDEVDSAKKDIGWHRSLRDQVDRYLDVALGPNEEDGAGSGLVGDVMLLGRQRDEARANLAASGLGDLMAGADEFERLAVALVPTLMGWRQQFAPGTVTDGWSLTIKGRRPGEHLGDRVTSVQMDLRFTADLETEDRLIAVVDRAADPERTQELVKPGDSGYPTRPQRLADAMRLRQSFPTETPDSPEPEPPQQP